MICIYDFSINKARNKWNISFCVFLTEKSIFCIDMMIIIIIPKLDCEKCSSILTEMTPVDPKKVKNTIKPSSTNHFRVRSLGSTISAVTDLHLCGVCVFTGVFKGTFQGNKL